MEQNYPQLHIDWIHDVGNSLHEIIPLSFLKHQKLLSS